MGGGIHVKDKKKGERVVRALSKPAAERAINESTDLPDAAAAIESLKKEMAKLKKRLRTVESRTGKLWAERGGGRVNG